MNLVEIYVNYLGPNIEADDMQAILDTGQSTSKLDVQRVILKGFFGLCLDCISSEMLARYVEATTGLHNMPFLFNKQIDERLLKPLKSAKRNYCFGDYMATVAASGVVAEMVAVLIWKINIEQLRDHRLTKQDCDKGRELGSAFEGLSQAYREKVLKKAKLIDSDDKSQFSEIRKLRPPFLHLWSTDTDKEKESALEAYKLAFTLFRKFVIPGIGDGGVLIVDPKLHKFL